MDGNASDRDRKQGEDQIQGEDHEFSFVFYEFEVPVIHFQGQEKFQDLKTEQRKWERWRRNRQRGRMTIRRVEIPEDKGKESFLKVCMVNYA